MRVGALVLVFGLVVAACGGGDERSAGAQTPEMMAVALEQLVTVDHTFGEGSPPFTEYLIRTSIDPPEGDHEIDPRFRALTEGEREAIEAAISAFGPVRWIDDPNEFRTPDLMPTVEGAVILGVGEPVIDGDSGEVPVSLWCSGLCGTWFTYALEFVDGSWRTTGTTGPVMMS